MKKPTKENHKNEKQKIEPPKKKKEENAKPKKGKNK